MLAYYTAFEGVIAYSFTRPVKTYKVIILLHMAVCIVTYIIYYI